MYTFTSR